MTKECQWCHTSQEVKIGKFLPYKAPDYLGFVCRICRGVTKVKEKVRKGMAYETT